MWLTIALLAGASTAEAKPVGTEVSEQIYVFGDRFARWERRWWIETEVFFLKPLTLLAERNHEVAVQGVQIRAVYDCSKDWKIAGDNWEVSCKIEDIGLKVAPRIKTKHADAVLAEIDEKLTGATLQLQVGASGQVANVDLEGIEHRNERTRQALENMRQLMGRAILPFHLKQPKVLQEGMRWEEYNSHLFALPSVTASTGSSVIAHYLNSFSGMLLVQSIGKGTIGSDVGADRTYVDGDGGTRIESMPTDMIEMKMDGVAVYDPKDGVLTERVWSISGGYSASSPSALNNATYWNAGSLKMLAPGQRPDVGTTELVTFGNHDGLERWKPLAD